MANVQVDKKELAKQTHNRLEHDVRTLMFRWCETNNKSYFLKCYKSLLEIVRCCYMLTATINSSVTKHKDAKGFIRSYDYRLKAVRKSDGKEIFSFSEKNCMDIRVWWAMLGLVDSLYTMVDCENEAA